MNHREVFNRIMSGEPTGWVPNYELGCWGQTTQRWIEEGAPTGRIYFHDMFEGGPLFGPDIFRAFFRRPYRRIVERLRAAGIASIWLDSDGDAEVLIPEWLDVGVNCFWPLEQEKYKEIVSARIYDETNMTPDGKVMKGRDGAWVMPIFVNGRIYCRDLRGDKSEIVCLDPGKPPAQ
jgi:hypothetical protein